MTTAPSGTSSGRRAQLEAAAELVAHARRDLAAGGAPDMNAILKEVAAVDRELALIPAASVQELRPLLLALLDEIGLLTAVAHTRKSELAARLHSASAHHRAGTAYRRTSRR